MGSIILRDKSGLHPRAADVVCPVLWLHGTNDRVNLVANAEEEIQLFKNSPDAMLENTEDHPKVVAENVTRFIKKYATNSTSLYVSLD